MNFKTKYDNLIQAIESAVEKKDNQIPELLSKQTGINLRLLADAFQFITDMTLNQYIRQRRLVRALQYKYESVCSLEDAATEYGFSDAATMSKAFKNYFHISPSQMSQNELNQQHPLTLEQLLSEGGNEVNMEHMNNNPTATPDTMFGVPVEKFEDIKKAFEINAVYGLSDKLAETAYTLSKKHHISMFKAFDFVEDLKLQLENGTYLGSISSIRIPEIALLSLQYNLSVSEAIDEIERLHSDNVSNICKLPKDFWKIYFGEANKQFNFPSQDILSFLHDMKLAHIPTEAFDDIVICDSVFYDGDISEAISNYGDNSAFIPTEFDAPDMDSTPQNIWEMDECEYHEYLDSDRFDNSY